MKTPQACSVVGNGAWQQESYETASRDAAVRARQVRALGFHATVFPMGSQVTPLGVLKLTMVDIRPGNHADLSDLPRPATVEWPR